MPVTLTPDYFNQLGHDNLPGLLGIVITEVREGLLKAELPVAQRVMAANGFLHGGTVVSLADTCAGYGTIANLPEGASSFTTIELKMNYLGTARDGVIECCATAAHLGRTTQVWDATVRAKGSDRAIALFRCTQLVLYPKK